MEHYQETFETWNKIASLYQEKFMDLDLYNQSYDRICDAIPQKHARLLDVGCGPGNITKYLLSKRQDFIIDGIDIAPNMIALAQKNNPNARFSILDSRNIDQIETTYDGIVCGFCLPYLSHNDCPKFISDCFHLLNDEGLLYLSFVEGDPEKSNFQTGSSGDRSFFYFYEVTTLKNQLTAQGFKEINSINVTYKRTQNSAEMHTILLAKKKKTNDKF